MTYSEYIDGIITERGQWNIPEGEYYESHHIIPKSMGGEGKQYSKHENIIWLYPEEHFIAHVLLNQECNIRFPYLSSYTPEEFGAMRRASAKKNVDAHVGKNLGPDNPNYGNHKLAGTNHPCYGKKRPPETIQKMRESQIKYYETHDGPNKGRKFSEEWKQHMRDSRPDMNGEKNPMWGKTQSEETRKKISAKRTGKKYITNGIETKMVYPSDPIPEGWRYGRTLGTAKS